MDEDIPEAELSEASITTNPPSKRPQNAFQTLMSSPSRKHKSSSTILQHMIRRPSRAGLGVYLSAPASFPSDIVLYHNEHFVVIRDKFPKSSIHLLILPRTGRTRLHPFVAFQDGDLLASTRAEAIKVKGMVAEELRRMFGRESVTEGVRRAAIEHGIDDGGVVPEGRDWEAEVMVGVHAGPSMSHLHVHVLSRDRISPCMKHGKHYNSFNTEFFVGLEELPLKEEDVRWRKDRGGGLREDLECWRCGRGFENRFAKLKSHLDEEFEEWKKD